MLLQIQLDHSTYRELAFISIVNSLHKSILCVIFAPQCQSSNATTRTTHEEYHSEIFSSDDGKRTFFHIIFSISYQVTLQVKVSMKTSRYLYKALESSFHQEVRNCMGQDASINCYVAMTSCFMARDVSHTSSVLH